MKVFSGFPPGKVTTVNLPEMIFTDLIPMIDDLLELKITLHVLWRLGQQEGRVRYLRHGDLVEDRVLLASLDDAVQDLENVLDRCVERGTLLRADDSTGDSTDVFYFANTPKGRAAIAAIEGGHQPAGMQTDERPGIFTLYEQNIGLLTPMISEELREAEQTYPIEWIEEAFREAVMLNKRNWKYIRAILQRWHTEGKGDEEDRKPDEADRKKYISGKYSEFIKH